MAKKIVSKTELYQIRLKASEKLLIQEAAARAGMGTAEYWSGVIQAVSYVLMKYEPEAVIMKEELEKLLGASVASIVWPGLGYHAPEAKEKKSENET